MVDSIRAADFNTRHLLLALEAGEPYRIARALALEAAFLASGGMPPRLCRRVRGAGRLPGEAIGPPARGGAVGAHRRHVGVPVPANGRRRRGCASARWSSCGNSARAPPGRSIAPRASFSAPCCFRERFGEVSRRLPALLTAARDRGNRYFETELRTRMNLVWLAADQPDEGERHANEAMAGWSHEGFHRQHYSHVLARIQTELYRGDAEAAWRLVARQLAGIRAHAAPARPVPAHRSVVSAGARRAAQRRPRTRRRALSVDRPRGRPAHRALRDCAGRMRSRLLLGAAVAYLEGRSGAAREMLAAAVTAFERADMRFHAAVARRRLGGMQDDERGRALVDDGGRMDGRPGHQESGAHGAADRAGLPRVQSIGGRTTRGRRRFGTMRGSGQPPYEGPRRIRRRVNYENARSRTGGAQLMTWRNLDEDRAFGGNTPNAGIAVRVDLTAHVRAVRSAGAVTQND